MFAAQTVALLLSCVGLLALALIGILRSGRSPLGLRLALLCLNLFAWESASLAHELSGAPEWRWLNLALSPLAAPLALDFALAFAGRLRELRAARAAAWSGLGLLALSGGLAFVWPPARTFAGSGAWAALYLGGLAAAMWLVILLLVRHLRDAGSAEERRRAQLLLFAIALGALSGATNLMNDLWPAVPSIGAPGILAASAVTAVVALRFQLFDNDLPVAAGLLALVLACGGVAVHLRVFQLLGPQAGVLALGSAALSLAVFAATRSFFVRATFRRQRRAELTFLGRLSAQMAHDLKNPLAALKGAAQYADEEDARAQAPEARRRFTRLMIEQIERVERVVDRYQRLSRVEPCREPLAINQVVREVLALQQFAIGRVELRLSLAEPLPHWNGDRDLIAAALENLVRNAFEAMPDGGAVTVSTGFSEGSLFLSVEDTGAGMDARTRERAFDDFFTTKAQGSGLGLPFVRRVAEAHGGHAQAFTALPHGTVVRLQLPLK